MKPLFVLPTLLLVVFITQSCGSGNASNSDNKIKDTFAIESSRYNALIEAYQTQPLSNDTVFLGFRIGMTLPEVDARVALLIKNGVVTRVGNRIFSYIASNEWTQNDKDSVHQFIVEILLGINKKEGVLKGINANIYAPRFLLTPNPKKVEDENNPSYNAYKEIVGDSMVQANKQTQDDRSVERIKRFVDEHLLSSYRLRYGSENHKIENSFNTVKYVWISNGRLIELDLDREYNQITKKLLERELPLSTDNFSELVFIGSASYYPISEKVNYEKAVDKAASEFQKKSDSTIKSDQQKENQLTKDRVKNSGI